MQHGDTGHLNGKLKRDSEHDLSKVGSVSEDLIKVVSKDEYGNAANRKSVLPTNLSPSALGVGLLPNLEAHLLEFLLNKRVVFVTTCMESSESGQRLFFSADNHQPTGRERQS